MKRAIEEGFPIVEINRLAVPERNAFKPVYQMHKWFARRARRPMGPGTPRYRKRGRAI
jgi:adenine-specific DNA methylase